MLQCLDKVDFILDGHPTTCYALQAIELSPKFQLEYLGQKLSKEHTTAHTNMVQSTWQNEYSFDNLPKSILEEDDQVQSVVHPVLDAILLTPAGQVSVEKISILSFSTVLFISVCCGACLYKSQRYRNCLWEAIKKFGAKLYNCFTSKTYRAKKENKLLKKGVEQAKNKIRENIHDLNLLTSLEKNLVNVSQTSSLPELSRAVTYEDRPGVPRVDFSPLGAHGGTEWHRLGPLEEKPAITRVEVSPLGAHGGPDRHTLRPLGNPREHQGYKSHRGHREQSE